MNSHGGQYLERSRKPVSSPHTTEVHPSSYRFRYSLTPNLAGKNPSEERTDLLGDISLHSSITAAELKSGESSPIFQSTIQGLSVSIPQVHHRYGDTDNEIPPPHVKRPCDWLPATLRLQYLVILFAVSLGLGTACFALVGASTLNYGLGTDDGSSRLIFGWRFTPTLFVVIYVVLLGALFVDVKRTEIFARLSKPHGASAPLSLTFPSRSWWNVPVDALSRKQNASSRSWALFLTAVINIVGFLVISPLSAGLIMPLTIQRESRVPFSTFNPASGSFQTDSEDALMFRTISGSIIDKPTSAWVSNDYAILPFWPPGGSNIPPLGATFPASTSQSWSGQTTAYRAEMSCLPMEMTAMFNTTFNSPVKTLNGSIAITKYNVTAITLSLDSCSITLLADRDWWGTASRTNWLTLGGGWWSSSSSRFGSLAESGNGWERNFTQGCEGKSMFFVNTPWIIRQPFQISSQLCSTKYLQAEISALVALSPSNTSITFDTASFAKTATTMSPLPYDIKLLENSFFSQNWTTKFKHPGSGNTESPRFSGPLMAITASAKYNNSIERLLPSDNLIEEARKFQQRYFGEMLLSAFQSGEILQASKKGSGQGELRLSERRIVAALGIGVTLGVLFFLSAAAILGIWYFSRLERRPLGLHHDPGTIAAATALVIGEKETRAQFDGFDRLSEEEVKQKLGSMIFRVEGGKLLVLGGGNEEDTPPFEVATKHEPKDPRPTVLRTWMAPVLSITLLALIAVLLVLYYISQSGGLHSAYIVYEFNFRGLTIFAPYSIIPTFMAIGVKLWFGAIEDTLKRFQPWASMASKAAPVEKSVTAEYVNAPLLVASWRGWRNGHWLIALVGFAALGTETFTVSMSALWTREVGSLSQIINLQNSLELRTVPILFDAARTSAGVKSDPTKTTLLNTVYGNFLTSWLYSAAVEISQNASTPPWSMDTWSFVPVSLPSISTLNSSAGNVEVASQAPNITYTTSALRARLECSNVGYVSNTSLWLREWDFNNKTLDPRTNLTLWNATNRPSNLDIGYELFNSIAHPKLQYKDIAIGPSTPSQMICCSNETDGVPGEAAIGYWTDNSTYGDGRYRNVSMVAKWIVGRRLDGLYNDTAARFGSTHWIWADIPKISAITCSPVIEAANVSVTVESTTGVVQSYSIIGTPRNASEAWSDYYLYHNVSSDYKSADNRTYYGTTPTVNLTTSYGYVFWDALLGAANSAQLGLEMPKQVENMADHSFNFRIRSLNADFMSYSMLALAGGNAGREALLDPNELIKKANYVFGVFFKHFVSENITDAEGGWAYQPIGAKLPAGLGNITDYGVVGRDDDRRSPVDTPRSLNAVLSTPVEQLVVSGIAVGICVGVLAFLIIVTVIIFAGYRRELKVLPRDVDTLASVLGFVYGSRQFLEWVRRNGSSRTWNTTEWKGKYRLLPARGGGEMVRLGGFENGDGRERWGVEIVDPIFKGERSDDVI